MLDKTEDEIQEQLLQTIRIPKNMLFLTDRLPRANYEEKVVITNKNQSFPKLNNNNNESIDIDEETKKQYLEKKGHHGKKKKAVVDGSSKNIKDISKEGGEIDEDYKRKKKEYVREVKSPKRSIDTRARSPKSPEQKYEYINHEGRKIVIDPNRLSPVPNKPPKEKEKDKNYLPSIHRHGSVDMRYVNNDKYENEVNRLDRNLLQEGNRIMRSQSPHKNQRQQHVEEIYKIYAPYLKLNKNMIQKYLKNNSDKSYVKNLEKYYNFDNNGNYKPKKNQNEIFINDAKVALGRKLSPIRRKI